MTPWPANPSLPLVLTPGEPAGIGGELTLKAWLAAREDDTLPAFFTLDNPERLRGLAAALGWDIAIAEIEEPEQAQQHFAEALPVLRIELPDHLPLGRPSRETAAAVVESIAQAVSFLREARAGAIVTNPIHKAVLMESGFTFPGHTEYLGDLAGTDVQPVMMLANPQLRVVPVTVHQSLASVPGTLTRDLIEKTGRITARALARDFGIDAPRLAVAGLNPHAGEDGALGREEIEIVAPACEALRAEGIDVLGPVAGDSLFHEAARERYDAALCMYHDQALIPLKTLDFERGVNITLGLPFVRTSPDHGTAFDIAGSGKASPTSLIEALRVALAMVRARAEQGDG